jgi:peptide/nickel transport system permease protein
MREECNLDLSKTTWDLLNFWDSYKKNKGALIGLIIILFFCTVGLLAPIIAPNPSKVGVGPRFVPPSWEFPMGTDNLGRDMFQGVISGARISLIVGFAAAGTSMIIGIVVGSISGYMGGRVDSILMRITEYFQIVPGFFLALIMVTLLGGSVWNVVIIIAVLSWPRVARLIRAQFLSLKEKEFIEAPRAVGESTYYIIFGEILINALPPAIVNSSLEVGRAIIVEAGLSFIGLGDPNKVSWGYLLRNAQEFLRSAWWMAFFPGACIFLLVTALNLVGDGLNDVLNPRLKER